MRTHTRSNPFFDTHSVLLFAALAAGGVVATQAHSADNAAPRSAASVIAQATPSSGSRATLTAPPAATNPANKPPAMSQKNDAPPMTTSPAFGPTSNADQATGGATNPDKRPEIDATRPTTAAKMAADRTADRKKARTKPAPIK